MYGIINIWLSICFVMRVFDIKSLAVAQHAGKLHSDMYFVEMSLAGVKVLLLVCPFHTVYMFNPLSFISRRCSLCECVK
jgi:hypothetical protein